MTSVKQKIKSFKALLEAVNDWPEFKGANTRNLRASFRKVVIENDPKNMGKSWGYWVVLNRWGRNNWLYTARTGEVYFWGSRARPVPEEYQEQIDVELADFMSRLQALVEPLNSMAV